MRTILLAIAATLLAGCGPASKLNYAQRAEIQCRVTGRDAGACMGRVMDGWSALARACGIRGNILTVCNGEFERRYYCNVSTREEKFTDEKGNVTTKSVETRSGPGCGMDASRRYELANAYRAECERRSDPPNTSPIEGANCYCGTWGCSFDYPNVSDDTALRFFPELADKK